MNTCIAFYMNSAEHDVAVLIKPCLVSTEGHVGRESNHEGSGQHGPRARRSHRWDAHCCRLFVLPRSQLAKITPRDSVLVWCASSTIVRRGTSSGPKQNFLTSATLLAGFDEEQNVALGFYTNSSLQLEKIHLDTLTSVNESANPAVIFFFFLSRLGQTEWRLAPRCRPDTEASSSFFFFFLYPAAGSEMCHEPRVPCSSASAREVPVTKWCPNRPVRLRHGPKQSRDGSCGSVPSEGERCGEARGCLDEGEEWKNRLLFSPSTYLLRQWVSPTDPSAFFQG